MISPGGMAIAAMTVMLWILWSDSFRRRPHAAVYVIRVALFLIVAGVLTTNMIRMPAIYSSGTRAVTIAAVAVGIGGAVYFVRKLVKR